MDEAKKEERRRLLAELDGSWEAVAAPPAPPESVPPDVAAAFDEAADRLVESLHPPPASIQEMADLDAGWEDEEDEEEEDEEPEPELPDERIDPVAYAEAKKAQDARLEARAKRKRLKAEAKKARRKARMDAAKAKQKAKSKKTRNTGANQAAKVAQAKARGPEAIAKSRVKTITRAELEAADEPDVEERISQPPVSKKEVPRKLPPSVPRDRLAKAPLFTRKNAWLLLVPLAVIIAAAIFASVISR